MNRANCHGRRCFVLIAVLVVIGSSLLVATSLLFVAQTEAAASAGAKEAAQARALAWSGLQVLMSQLDDQRERFLRGDVPSIDDHYIIYESGNRRGIVKLLPVSGRAGDPLLSAEAGKLDLNHVEAAALAATGCIDADAAQAIVAFRENVPGGRLRSIVDLLRVPGANITADRLYGPLDQLLVLGDARSAPGDVDQTEVAHASVEATYRGLMDLLTVHAVEPVVQMSGEPRINLNVSWSDELGRRVEARFDREAAELLKRILESGVKLDSDAKIIATLRRLQVAPEDWPAILDAFTTSDEPVRFNRLDINTATFEAMCAIPGVSVEQAAQMVRVRAELSADERATIAWPVLAQVISPEQFESLADRITTRCWAYRVRLAAGEALNAESHDWTAHPVIYEAVIDCSSSRPRVAYLRDITVLEQTATIAADVRVRPDGSLARGIGD